MFFDRLPSIPPRQLNSRPRIATIAALLTLSGLFFAAVPTPASAGLVLQAQNSVVSAGSSGSFDVVLLNTGGTFLVSGFSVELSTSGNSGVTFTAATTGTTTPYLFSSLQLPPLTFGTFPNRDFTATDTDMTTPGYVSLTTPGQTFGLEHVSYQVASGTVAGPVAVSIVLGASTQILDVNANLIPFATTNGTITVNSTVIPEPPSLVAWVMAGISLLGTRYAVNLKQQSCGSNFA